MRRLGRGKALSYNCIPDDLLPDDELKKIVWRDRDLIFRGPRL